MNFSPFDSSDHSELCDPDPPNELDAASPDLIIPQSPSLKSKPALSQSATDKYSMTSSKGDINAICHFNVSLKHKVYVYPIPEFMRENPRRDWRVRFESLEDYNDSNALNFGFGRKMYDDNDPLLKDFYLTHMHSLEVIFNERLKVDDYYLTDNPDEAWLFHIPFPFALHYRFWERTEAERLKRHHQQLQEWLNGNEAFQRYFIDETNRRPHILTFGRIAYETVRLENQESQFFSINNGKQVRLLLSGHVCWW